MLCCHCLESLDHFLTRDSTVSFCTGSYKPFSWSFSWRKALEGTRDNQVLSFGVCIDMISGGNSHALVGSALSKGLHRYPPSRGDQYPPSGSSFLFLLGNAFPLVFLPLCMAALSEITFPNSLAFKHPCDCIWTIEMWTDIFSISR